MLGLQLLRSNVHVCEQAGGTGDPLGVSTTAIRVASQASP